MILTAEMIGKNAMQEYKIPKISGFITEKTQASGTTLINNIHFFPDIYLLDFQQRYKLDNGTAEERQINALQTAMMEVNEELMNPNARDCGIDWVNEQLNLGYCHLDAVPALKYGACSAKLHHYRTAIYARAKAELLERSPDVDTTRSGHDRADKLEETADKYLAEGRVALRQLMDKPRMTVDLI